MCVCVCCMYIYIYIYNMYAFQLNIFFCYIFLFQCMRACIAAQCWILVPAVCMYMCVSYVTFAKITCSPRYNFVFHSSYLACEYLTGSCCMCASKWWLEKPLCFACRKSRAQEQGKKSLQADRRNLYFYNIHKSARDMHVKRLPARREPRFWCSLRNLALQGHTAERLKMS